MKRSPCKITAATAILAIVLIFAPALRAGDVHLTFDHYYDGPATERALRDLHKAYPDLTELRSIGVSEEGREIWLLTINNAETGGDLEKPGIYVDGSIHGNEIQATEVCLYLAWYLLDSYDGVPKVKGLVDEHAFYIIPIVNVDSRARFFTDPSGYNIGRTARVPYDDDRDGLLDEDDYDDLDGDGEILQMRVRQPYGDYKLHPDDPRVLVRVKPGEIGQWRLLGREGIDNDGDGRLNEDVPGYLDMNRNYGFKWQPPYIQRGAGDFPMSGKVTKAVADFVVTKPNICFNFAFHNMGGMILRGPGSKLSGLYPPGDVKVYDYLAGEGQKMLPGYRYMVGYKDMYTTHGDFDEFMYSCNGIFGFVGELFMSSQEQYRKPGERAPGAAEGASRYSDGTPSVEKQKFSDILNQGTMFKDWEAFDHPQFGEVEIGGWRTFTTRISPTFMLHELVHRNASLVLFTASHAPEVTLEPVEVKKLADGLHRVRVRASNPKAIPTISGRARQRKIVRKDILKLEGNGLSVVSGGIVRDSRLGRVRAVEHRPWMIFTHVPSFGAREVQWIVSGSGRATITFDSIKARNRTISIDL
jgi:hypothetical protein